MLVSVRLIGLSFFKLGVELAQSFGKVALGSARTCTVPAIRVVRHKRKTRARKLAGAPELRGTIVAASHPVKKAPHLFHGS